jgi:hypothetical protein
VIDRILKRLARLLEQHGGVRLCRRRFEAILILSAGAAIFSGLTPATRAGGTPAKQP